MKVFLEENSKLNLSALRTEEQCWIGNILDSISLLEVLPTLSIIHSQFSILDVGTGGGFPLLPLALTLPNSVFTGLDATQKKIDAVKRIAEKMDLKNVKLIAGRAEAIGHDKEFREQFELVLSRAVAPINVLLEYCSPFTKPGGHVILRKSLNIEQELKDSLLARAELSCHLIKQHEYTLPGDFGTRQLLVFEKSGKLSRRYPREVGVPKKEPIE